MAKYRTLSLRCLKPECVQDYVSYHQQVWPELLEAYHQAGITRIDCCLNGSDLVVCIEYDSDVYEKMKDALRHNPIEIRWQALMETFRDISVEQRFFEEVFHWES